MAGNNTPLQQQTVSDLQNRLEWLDEERRKLIRRLSELEQKVELKDRELDGREQRIQDLERQVAATSSQITSCPRAWPVASAVWTVPVRPAVMRSPLTSSVGTYPTVRTTGSSERRGFRSRGTLSSAVEKWITHRRRDRVQQHPRRYLRRRGTLAGRTWMRDQETFTVSDHAASGAGSFRRARSGWRR